jgi:glutamyl/glutaminyl-tRNA synthetase
MSDRVVTRFAPSPTGYLHVGGARTALFCWLWARKAGGTFILRIEDTDRKRNTPTAIGQVINDLRWLGLDWDEGPEIGGPNGPYFQSQRKDIYDKYTKKLLDKGKAYYCFETESELEALRKQAEAQNKGFVYQRPDRFPSEQDGNMARAEGRPVTIRFAVPQDETIVVSDIVRGEITFSPAEIGDFIIQKSDGFPTYNFACVVDDYLMKITHVIRGQEHLNNTPAQQLLWRALFNDAPLPKYVHMSVTVSDTGGKLSKRERPKALRQNIERQDITIAVEPLKIKAELQHPQIVLEELAKVGNLKPEELQSFIKGTTTPDMPSVDAMAEYLGVQLPEINIVDFFRSGYLPETMVNFLALLGWNPGDNREVMTVSELIESFDLSRLTKSNSLFDRQKLLAFNTEHIRMTPNDKLLEHFRSYLKAINSPVLAADDEVLLRIIRLCEGARTLTDIERKSRFLFLNDEAVQYDEQAVKKVLLKSDGIKVLQVIREKLAVMEDLSEQTIENMLRSLAEKRGVGLGKVAQPLRVAICGTTISLPIFDSVQMLGKKRTLTRIDMTLNKFRQQARAE